MGSRKRYKLFGERVTEMKIGHHKEGAIWMLKLSCYRCRFMSNCVFALGRDPFSDFQWIHFSQRSIQRDKCKSVGGVLLLEWINKTSNLSPIQHDSIARTRSLFDSVVGESHNCQWNKIIPSEWADVKSLNK